RERISESTGTSRERHPLPNCTPLFLLPDAVRLWVSSAHALISGRGVLAPGLSFLPNVTFVAPKKDSDYLISACWDGESTTLCWSSSRARKNTARSSSSTMSRFLDYGVFVPDPSSKQGLTQSSQAATGQWAQVG
ncbi:unnamed protein product, partial [Ectocarpus sp. 12 AP-2014]